MSSAVSPFAGMSPDSYAAALERGIEYLGHFENHTCQWINVSNQPLTGFPDRIVPAITLGITRHFPRHTEYKPPIRLETLSHVIDFSEQEGPPLQPNTNRHYREILSRTKGLLKLMQVVGGEFMDYPVINAWAANLDTATPIIRIDAAQPAHTDYSELLERHTTEHGAAVEDDHLVFAGSLPYIIDPQENVYSVHYGFNVLGGAMLRAAHGL